MAAASADDLQNAMTLGEDAMTPNSAQALAPRLLLAFSSLVLAAGGTAHAVGFKQALATIATSNLSPYFASCFKLLWLADSATQFVLSAVFCLLAARPDKATGLIVSVLALVPAASAALVYMFIGNFYGGHILMAAAGAAFGAGVQRSRSPQDQSVSPP